MVRCRNLWVLILLAGTDLELVMGQPGQLSRHRVAIQKVAKGVSLGVAVASSIMLNLGAVVMGQPWDVTLACATPC